MSGIIGQADTGVLYGGGFELTGGFWGAPVGTEPLEESLRVYLPLVVKN